MTDFTPRESIGVSETEEENQKAIEIACEKIGNPDLEKYIIKTGWITREGQRIYYLEWGNKDGVPFIDLHGGPGASFEKSHVALFDPTKDHVLFFDQRGCGKSTPSASGLTKEETAKTNTPMHVVEDMEFLRQQIFRGADKVNVAGGSYGSTLAFVYAIMHPERVESMELWSGFLGEKGEIDEMFTDRSGQPGFTPAMRAAWDRFISFVPENRRGSGRKVLEYYAEMISDTKNEKSAQKHALEFELFEDTLCSPDGYDPAKLEEEVASNPNLLSWARIEILYHANGEYLPEEAFIMNNINKIKNIPCRIVQGERDMCTPRKHADRLKAAYGKQCTVQEVPSGHMRSDKAMREALQKNITSHVSKKKN